RSANHLVDAIFSAVAAFSAGTSPYDDQTVVVLRVQYQGTGHLFDHRLPLRAQSPLPMSKPKQESSSSALQRRPAFTYDHVLRCERVPLPRLAEQYGTPLYVYSGTMIRERFWTFDEAF